MVEGGCRCGAVRYTLALDALPSTYACHCHLCQRWTGSAFSLQALVPEASLTVTGPIAIYEKTTDDRTSTQRVCAVCHARIYNTNTRRPGVAVVRAGTLDRSEELVCTGHIFTAYRQTWFVLPDGVPQWPEAPAPAEFAALMARPQAT
ncbi:GFA family protein [Sphingomonas sp. BIUV-7]|uniref:GFA family protein n=1 Tax=Sphingomonas natans TaxID=3063330 RepID=A0ABT8Y3V7_9SPHN|nr:GFA family protein [Sphingomonas sp. BIUV-7]MDO6412997.1 GFA family protein [Sphingomonas sp. BIUV-7]